MKKLKHSKFKNTGFLYLILIRNICIDVLEGKDNAPSYNLLKRFFKYGTLLNELLLLYNVLLNNTVNSKEKALMLINLTIKLHNRLNYKKLNSLKYNLINLIRSYYDILTVFNTKILNYTLMASIYKLFESQMITLSIDPMSIINSKYNIIESLIQDNTNKKLIDTVILKYNSQDKDTQILAYKILIEKFNLKYSEALNLDQKILLQKYIYGLSNASIIKEHVLKLLPVIREALNIYILNIEDEVLKIKLHEINNQLSTLNKGKIIKLNLIIILLKAYTLMDLLLDVLK